VNEPGYPCPGALVGRAPGSHERRWAELSSRRRVFAPIGFPTNHFNKRAKHHPLTMTRRRLSPSHRRSHQSRPSPPPTPSSLRSQLVLTLEIDHRSLVPHECPVLVIHERLHNLLARVHDKGSVPADRLSKRLPCQEQRGHSLGA